MKNIISKLPNATTSIFPLMTALANKHGATNLAQGFPGFSADKELINLMNTYTSKGYNQYAPLMGNLKLREKLSEKTELLRGKYYHPEKEIVITAGATQAIYSAITAVINKGDEVIIIEPAYDCYEPAIILNGGTPIRSQLSPITYEINWNDIASKVTSLTKLIMVNTPHNPTGKIWKQSDIDALIKITSNTNILILSDEVYEHITFDNQKHLSVSSYPELAERAFVVFSFGKTYHLTGWRTGYVLAPEFLIKEFVKCHQFQVYAVNTPIQHALADYSDNHDAYLNLPSFFQKKRDLFLDLIKGSKFKPVPSEGTYFMLLDYSEISDQKDTEFANLITEKYKIATIPTSVFFNSKRQDKVVRVCFAKSDEELKKGAKALHLIK